MSVIYQPVAYAVNWNMRETRKLYFNSYLPKPAAIEVCSCEWQRCVLGLRCK